MKREKFALLQVPASKVIDWAKFVTAGVLFICVSYLGPRISLEWSQHKLPLALHLVVLGFWAIVTMLYVRMITGEFGKSMFIESYVNGILWPPFVYSLALLCIAACVFASTSVTLHNNGYAIFEPPLPRDLAPVVDFYMWHFWDSVPGLGIPATLRWTQPYQYSDHLSGSVLLVFKIAVIVPVIASFKLWHDVRKTAVARKSKKEASRTEGNPRT